MKLFSVGLNYCNEHVCYLEKKRTDGRLPLLFVRKLLGELLGVGKFGSGAV